MRQVWSLCCPSLKSQPRGDGGRRRPVEQAAEKVAADKVAGGGLLRHDQRLEGLLGVAGVREGTIMQDLMKELLSFIHRHSINSP